MKNIRNLYKGINDFKKGYQPRTNIVKDEKSGLVTVSQSILVRWRKRIYQLFNAHGVSNVRQRKIHTTEPIVPALCVFELEMAIEELKGHKSPGIDQIPAELIKAGGKTIRYEIHKIITSIWNRDNCLGSARNRSLYLSIRRAIKHIVVIIKAYHFCQLRTKCYPTSFCQG
jgi:hypothetical protein